MGKRFFSSPIIQSSTGAHPASYFMGSRGFSLGKATGEWCWLPTYIYC